MDVRVTLAIAIAPAILLLWLFKKWDEKRPEPAGAVRNVVIFGMISCVPAAVIEVLATNVLGKSFVEEQGQLVNAFLIAAFTEEAVKLAVVVLYLWRKPHFDEVMDGILYTAAASLGFALLENVLYSVGNPLTGFVRAFTAVPLHATCSGIMGYFVGRAKMTKGSASGWMIGGFAAAVFIHGFYDWIVFSGAGFGFFEPMPLVALFAVFALVMICGVILRQLVKHALSMDDAILGSQPRPLVPAPAFGPPVQPWGVAPAPYAAAYAPGAIAPQPYPPQQQPYPQQGYPQQPYPQQSYPQQPYPQQPYPQQPYPQQGHPQQPQYPQQHLPQQPYAAPQEPQHPGAPPRGPYDPRGGQGGYGT